MKTKEEILLGVMQEERVPISFDATPTVFWNDAIVAMQAYADLYIAEVERDKDAAIAIWIKEASIYSEMHQAKSSELSAAKAEVERLSKQLIVTERFHAEDSMSANKQIGHLQSELSAANQRIAEMEDNWIGKENGLPKPDYSKT